VRDDLVGIGDRRQGRATVAGLAAGLAARRAPKALLDRRLGSPSEDGGRDELREFCASRRFSSTTSASSWTTRASSRWIVAACSTTNAASCSYDGRPEDT
jgi:hypothetical protein